jgi:hypothetical protein
MPNNSTTIPIETANIIQTKKLKIKVFSLGQYTLKVKKLCLQSFIHQL